MNRSRVALPEPPYCARIGEVAYTVSSMEWKFLGDIDGLRDELPEKLSLVVLEPLTAGEIAGRLEKAAVRMTKGPVRTYVEVCGRVLRQAASIRNDVLHARPATHPEQDQRLNRAGTRREGGKFVLDGTRFWITDEWIDEQIGRLNELLDEMNEARSRLPERS